MWQGHRAKKCDVWVLPTRRVRAGYIKRKDPIQFIYCDWLRLLSPHTHTHTQIGLFLVARPTYFLQFWDDLSWMYRRYVGYYLRNGATNNNDQLRQPSRVQKSFHTTTSGFNPTLKSLHKPFSLNSLKSLPTEALADCFSLLMQKWFTPLCVTSLVFYPVWAPTWAIFWINNSTWKTIFFFLL